MNAPASPEAVSAPPTAGRFDNIPLAAAKIAGLERIPASIRTLTPEQVLEIQLVENLQREGLHPMEEAEGYAELMKLKRLTADAVASAISKGRSYVYGRLKLLDLCPEARKAFYAGDVSASVAQLIARIPSAEVQKQALDECINGFDGDLENLMGPLTFKQAQERITDAYIADLKAAPFKLDDATLVPNAGPCTTCPKRTGNQADLFTDVKNPNACTDTACLEQKRVAFIARTTTALQAAGKKLVPAKSAEKLFKYGGRLNTYGTAYIEPDHPVEQHPKRLKASALVGPDAILTVISPEGTTHQVIARSAIDAALEAKGIKTREESSTSHAAQNAKHEHQRRIDRHYHQALITTLRARYTKQQPSLQDLRHLAADLIVHYCDGLDTGDADILAPLWLGLKSVTGFSSASYYDTRRQVPKDLGKLDGSQISALMLDFLLLKDLRTESGDIAAAYIKEQGIDVKPIKAKAKIAADEERDAERDLQKAFSKVKPAKKLPADEDD